MATFPALIIFSVSVAPFFKVIKNTIDAVAAKTTNTI